MSAGSGSRRARSTSIPARPYICRFSILSRFMCPSTGPLLHGLLTAASAYRRSAPAGWSTRRVPYPTAPPPPAATVVWIPSRMLVQGASHPGTRRSLFGPLLLADATAKGIWRVPSSNPCSRASEFPRIACAHADSPLPTLTDVNSLGTIGAFPSAATSDFFPAARRAGFICRCAVGIGQVASRFDLPSCQRLSFA
jgi:hypothetical protein